MPARGASTSPSNRTPSVSLAAHFNNFRSGASYCTHSLRLITTRSSGREQYQIAERRHRERLTPGSGAASFGRDLLFYRIPRQFPGRLEARERHLIGYRRQILAGR